MPKNLSFHLIGIILSIPLTTLSQPCSPQGDPAVYGTNNVWMGYVYDNFDLTNYKGFVTEGSPASPDFQQEFGGALVNYPTNGCPVLTEAFSVRYRLTKAFTAGDYDFTIAGDDGYRLSLDGGATWIINNWAYLGFNKNTVTVYLDGTYNLVLEYFDYVHNNRLSFAISNACFGAENTSVYGTNNVWRGYVYNGTNFDFFKGIKNEGNGSSPDFDQNFGGSYARFNTSSCQLLAEHFSVRYRLTKTFASSNYSFTVGSEDGYRLSLDGGNSWLINNWNNTGYTTSAVTANLNGPHDMVLEYAENTGANRIMFSVGAFILLPVEFVSFNGKRTSGGMALQWLVGNLEANITFEIERSENGSVYKPAGMVKADPDVTKYSFIDQGLFSSRVYYRIKMQDAGGRIKYSHPIFIEAERATRIYPTFLNNGIIYITNENVLSSASFLLTDIAGRNVYFQQLGTLAAGQVTSIYLPSEKNLKGVYFVQLRNDNEKIKTESIIIQ